MHRIKKIEKAAIDQGWTVEYSANNHTIFYPKDKSKSRIVASPTDTHPRGFKNFLSLMQSAGFIWPWKGRERRSAKTRRKKRGIVPLALVGWGAFVSHEMTKWQAFPVRRTMSFAWIGATVLTSHLAHAA